MAPKRMKDAIELQNMVDQLLLKNEGLRLIWARAGFLKCLVNVIGALSIQIQLQKDD